MHVSVIIPAYNAAQTLPAVLAEIPRLNVQEIIVVDNGSTDQTFRVAQEARVKVVFEPRRGYGQACQSGLRALAPEADVVVFLDGDGSYAPADLPRLLEPLQQSRADVVLGSRLLGTQQPEGMGALERRMVRAACRLLVLRGGPRCTDVGSFRAIRRQALGGLRLNARGTSWLIDMQRHALKASLRLVEIPVQTRRRSSYPLALGTGPALATIWTLLRPW